MYKIKVYFSRAPNTTGAYLQALTNSAKKVLGEQYVSKEIKTVKKTVKNSSEAIYSREATNRYRLIRPIEVVCTIYVDMVKVTMHYDEQRVAVV